MGRRSCPLYWRWVLVCTAGELVGFGGIPVVAGYVSLSLTATLAPDARAAIIYFVSLVGGLGEGAVLAWFQLLVLRGYLPRLNAGRWIRSTSVAAAFAWMMGMLAPTLDDLVGISTTTQVIIWMPASVLILLSIGTAQSWVLADVAYNSSSWIVANALGWLLGLIWTFVLPALLPEDAPLSIWVSTFLIAGILMGLTVGLVTGHALISLRLRA